MDAALQESIAVQSTETEVRETWDEATFEAAAQAYLSKDVASSSTATSPPASEGSYSLPSPQPLRIIKKGKVRSTSMLPKDRSSWFEEAGLGEDGFTHTAGVSNPASSSGFITQTRQSSHKLAPVEEDQERLIAPPPFTAVSPSLDGPSFDEIDSMECLPNPHASPPPAPLLSQTDVHFSLPAPSIMASSVIQPESRHSSPRRSPSRTHGTLDPRPVPSAGSIRSRPSITKPVVGFDPSMAYTKPGHAANPGVQLRGNKVESFYNSAVVPHLTNWPSRPSLNTVNYPSQRPPGHNDWRNIYHQYPHPVNPALPFTPALPQYQIQQNQQQQQYQHHSD